MGADAAIAEDVDLEAQVACVKRELALRAAAYPKWVARGRLRQHVADREIAAMRAVLSTLERLQRDRLGLSLGFR